MVHSRQLCSRYPEDAQKGRGKQMKRRRAEAFRKALPDGGTAGIKDTEDGTR